MPKALTSYIVAVATATMRQHVRMTRCAIDASPDEALRAKCHIAAMQTLRDQTVTEAEREGAAHFPPIPGKTAPNFAPALRFNGR